MKTVSQFLSGLIHRYQKVDHKLVYEVNQENV
jgi:uncharacterized protein YutE (UPF0331/DUF86 family)